MNEITRNRIDDCLFCKIIDQKIPSAKFFDNADFIAILDIFPNTKGQTLVIPKNHTTSNVFEADFELVHKGLDTCKLVANILTKQLNPSRIALVTEGVFVDHLHFKLYPIYSENDFMEHENNSGFEGSPVYFEKFPGYITTKGGPQASQEDLDLLVGVLKK